MVIQEKTKTQIAKEYAETHKINDYKVKGNRMIYYENSNSLTTKVTVRLNTLQVEKQQLNYWNPNGDSNMKKAN